MNPVPTIPAMVAERIAAHPGKTILRKKDRGIWQAITWATLGERIRAIGGGLALDGCAGAVVGILAESGPDWVAIDLAVQGVGGIALGLPPTDPADATAATLLASGCSVLFVENEEQLDKVLQVRDRCPALRRIIIMDMKGLREFADPMCESLAGFSERSAASATAAASDRPAAAEDIAILAVTSGTSEAPRLVALSHANLMTQLAGLATLTGQNERDERLAFLPMSLVAERVFGLYLALYCGTISNFVESAETVPENLQEVRPTVMFAIPRIWEKLHAAVSVAGAGAAGLQRLCYRAAMALAERAPGSLAARLADMLVLRRVRAAVGLDRLRLAFSGGAPVSPDLVRWYGTLGITLRELYAVTECASAAALGAPVPWGELAIAGDGEVLVRGPHVCAGLWRDGRAVPAIDADGYFRTGDLGRIESGQLVLAGRIGEAITTQDGRRTMPAEFENRIKLSPFIADAVLTGEGRAALGCLVLLEHDAVEAWAHARNVPFTSAASLARADPVVSLIAAELAARAPGLALAGFRIIAQRIAPEDPEVTPAMRLRRRFVLRKYNDLIDDIYRAARQPTGARSGQQ